MSRSKLDPTQISQLEHDEASKAKRVRMVNTEINMELNHADGDSVTSHPAKLAVSVTGVDSSDAGKEIIPPMDCSSLSAVAVHVQGAGSVVVEISPVDNGSFFVEASAEDLKNLVARRIRVKSVNAQGSVHLVGRS